MDISGPPSLNPLPPGRRAALASALVPPWGLELGWGSGFDLPLHTQRGAHSEMVSAGWRKDTEEFGRQKRGGVGRDTPTYRRQTHKPLLQPVLK